MFLHSDVTNSYESCKGAVSMTYVTCIYYIINIVPVFDGVQKYTVDTIITVNNSNSISH